MLSIDSSSTYGSRFINGVCHDLDWEVEDDTELDSDGTPTTILDCVLSKIVRETVKPKPTLRNIPFRDLETFSTDYYGVQVQHSMM